MNTFFTPIQSMIFFWASVKVKALMHSLGVSDLWLSFKKFSRLNIRYKFKHVGKRARIERIKMQQLFNQFSIVLVQSITITLALFFFASAFVWEKFLLIYEYFFYSNPIDDLKYLDLGLNISGHLPRDFLVHP